MNTKWETLPGEWSEDILICDHKRGCQGREYGCSCGYDDAKDAEIVRLRAELLKLRSIMEANGAALFPPLAVTPGE